VLLVIVWLPTMVLVDFDTSQLRINTPTIVARQPAPRPPAVGS